MSTSANEQADVVDSMSRQRSTSAKAAFRFRIAMRVAAGAFGGYAFAWGFIAAGTSLLCAVGMGFHDAEFLASLLGVLAFLTMFLWTFAARRLRVVLAVLIGGGALLAAIGSLVQTAMI
jgi:hypothetical protein